MNDLISREAAIEAIRASAQKYIGFMEMEMYTDDDAVEAINGVPTAQHEDKCSECDAWNKYKNYGYSKQPERKKGKWIEVENKWGGLEIKCSECGAHVLRDEWGNEMQSDYCYRCGARMEGEEDETD